MHSYSCNISSYIKYKMKSIKWVHSIQTARYSWNWLNAIKMTLTKPHECIPTNKSKAANSREKKNVKGTSSKSIFTHSKSKLTTKTTAHNEFEYQNLSLQFKIPEKRQKKVAHIHYTKFKWRANDCIMYILIYV